MKIVRAGDFAESTLALGANLLTKHRDNWSLARERSPLDEPWTWVPSLGECMWQDERGYSAAIYKTPQGALIGYVRVPDYDFQPALVEIFRETIVKFEEQTQGMVFDQVDNRGGSMFQMYSLLSLLTDRALPTPTHEITIDDDYMAVATDALEMAAMGEELPPEERPAQERVDYCRLILAERAAGRGTGQNLSVPLHLEGIAEVRPAAQHYTKKLIVVNNAVTMSAGEFLSAMLQDGKRATIFGERTAGAGGCAKFFSTPNNFGIEGMTITWTIARRSNGAYIENVGVEPDVAYGLTMTDFQSKFRDGREALLKALAG